MGNVINLTADQKKAFEEAEKIVSAHYPDLSKMLSNELLKAQKGEMTQERMNAVIKSVNNTHDIANIEQINKLIKRL